MVMIRAGIERWGSSLPRFGEENDLGFPAEPQSAAAPESCGQGWRQGRCDNAAVASCSLCSGDSPPVDELDSASCAGLCREGCGANPHLGVSPGLRREL